MKIAKKNLLIIPLVLSKALTLKEQSSVQNDRRSNAWPKKTVNSSFGFHGYRQPQYFTLFNGAALLHSRKKWGFLTSFNLCNKFTYLEYEISHRKISEINFKAAKIKILRLSVPWEIFLRKTPNDICIVEEFRSKSRFCWGNEEWQPEIFGFSAALTLISLLFRYEI
jgi:hypothetical protein